MTAPAKPLSVWYVAADPLRFETEVVARDADEAISRAQDAQTAWGLLAGASWTVRKVEES